MRYAPRFQIELDNSHKQNNQNDRRQRLRSGLERRFYDDHDRKVNGSTPNLVSLLHPWIRCFTMIISAWWNPASSELKKSEAKFNRKTWKQRQLLSESGSKAHAGFFNGGGGVQRRHIVMT